MADFRTVLPRQASADWVEPTDVEKDDFGFDGSPAGTPSVQSSHT